MYIFLDNSNIWILQKKLSGKVQGKNDKFSSTDHKRFKSSCYEENLACRINFKWLGDLLGFKKGHDPSPHIFGSVPPDNERVWYMYEEAFSPKCVHLTKRTKEGKSTGEDQDLINVMLLTDYNKEDDLVLVAGDGGCLKPLRRLMERRQRAQWNRAQGRSMLSAGQLQHPPPQCGLHQPESLPEVPGACLC